MTKILIADDEKEIIALLKLYLEHNDVQIVEAYDGVTAWNILRREHVNLALVDIMMPLMSGYELIKKVRAELNIPVIIISAKTELNDRILGLDIGADDYVTKPFEPLEVAAKVRSRLRQLNGANKAVEPEQLTTGDLILDTGACILTRNGYNIELTKAEYLVLKLFMEYPGRVFTKEQIYEAGWNNKYAVDDNTIRVIISRLRDKAGEDIIQTIRGLGYRMVKKGL